MSIILLKSSSEFEIVCYYCQKIQKYKPNDLNNIPKRLRKKCVNCKRKINLQVEVVEGELKIKAARQPRICEYCGETFVPLQKNKRHCSTRCAEKNYRRNNKEKVAEWNRRSNKANKEKISECKKRWYQNNKERVSKLYKIWRESHKEEIADYQRQYRQNNKEKIDELKKIWRKAHKEKVVMYLKNYRQKVYEECELGVVKNTAIHKVFDFLNKCPSIEPKELVCELYELNPRTVLRMYDDWVILTHEKYQVRHNNRLT